MFEVLVESGARRPLEVGPRVAALSLHCVVVLAVGLGAKSVPRVAPTPVSVPIEIFGPAVPEPTRGTPSSRSGPGIDLAPAAPEVPIVVPAGIPADAITFMPGDTPLSAKGLAARDLRRQGPTGGWEASSTVRLAGEVDEQVQVMAPRRPVYPAALAAAGVEGHVRLEFVVDTVGHCEPGSVRVVSSTHAAFEGAAVEAVLGTVYRPAQARGRPVRQRVHQSLVFRVN